jgi:ribulose-phosphate 3-epimerase
MMCANLGELGAELARLKEAEVDSFHFDIMDGHFVPNLALTPEIVAALRQLTKRPFIAHLMVENPTDYVKAVAGAGADIFVFHIEASRYPRRMMGEVRAAGMVPGIAISPATSVTALTSVADVPCILVMSVEPGFAGADWIAGSPERVRSVRAVCGSETRIIVDGHIDLETAPALRAAGADMFVGGTKSIFAGDHTVEDYRVNVRALRQRLASITKGAPV